MKTFILCSVLLMTGCATQSQLAKIDDYAWSEYTCSGFKTWNDCKQAALAVCPRGFYVKNQFENITIQRREFEVACKG